MWLSRCAAALIVFLLPQFVVAQATCDDNPNVGEGWTWSGGASTYGGASPKSYTEALENHRANYGPWAGCPTCGTYTVYAEVCKASDTYGCRTWGVRLQRVTGGTITSETNILRGQVAPNPAYCTDPEPVCEAGNSYDILAIAANEAQAISAFNNTCKDGCKVTARSINDFWLPSGTSPGDMYGVIRLTETGDECTTEPATPEDTEEPPPTEPVNPAPEGENCVTSDAGVEYCDADSYGENCGYVNDNYVCLGKTDPDECWVNADGSRLCGESAPSPPVPDNGTPGQKATPTDTVQSTGPGGTSNTYNYYNSTVVAGSSRPAGDSGANPNRPDSYNPSTEPTPTVGAGGEGEGAEQGEAYDPTTPELAELDSFGDLTQAFWDGLQAAPIVAAWTGIGASVPTASCPSYSLTVFGQTYSFTEFMCELWDEQIAPVLSLVFLFVWPFIGLRIVMSA